MKGSLDRHWSRSAGRTESVVAPVSLTRQVRSAKHYARAARGHPNRIRELRQAGTELFEEYAFAYSLFEYPECAFWRVVGAIITPATISGRLRQETNMASWQAEIIHHDSGRMRAWLGSLIGRRAAQG